MTPPEPSAPPEDLQLRLGGEDDLDAVLEVYLAAVAAADHPLETRPTEAVRRWVGEALTRGDDLWLAERGGAGGLLGFATVRDAWLVLLFVHPERPGRGVGAALLDLVKALCPGGFGLRVHRDNARARAFYARHGLVELEATDGAAYDGQPDLRMAWLGEDPLAFLRGRIDEVDSELAVLLARRAALTAAVQDHKRVGGHAGRDTDREAEIVARMRSHVPELDPQVLTTVVHTLIAESLSAWERRRG